MELEIHFVKDLESAEHDVAPAGGITYTTEPPPAGEAIYGFGRCAHLAFIQYLPEAREANSRMELAIIDSVRFG